MILNATFCSITLKDAIPKVWREKLKTIKVPRNAISSDENPHIELNKKSVPIHLITNKLIYWKQINKIKITPVTKEKWIQEFGLKEESWEKIFEFQQLSAILK